MSCVLLVECALGHAAERGPGEQRGAWLGNRIGLNVSYSLRAGTCEAKQDCLYPIGCGLAHV
jgi:hypothetical protein